MNKVHIEFQRVQTWLFSVPRLRAMVGANTLLGETMRASLPDLARQSGKWSLVSAAGGYPNADPEDPLKSHDDPAADARQGILARDGGHFEAVFSTGADAFADAAADLLRRELPGLRFRISIDRSEQNKRQVSLSTQLPVLAPCEWTGRGVASVKIHQGTEQALVSLDVSRRHEAARRAEQGQASDLASLLAATTKLRDLPRPNTFQGLAGMGYLALILADGNGVGSAAVVNDLEQQAKFFHRNRVLLRRALKEAIDAECVDMSSAPLLPLMLGGDDLLIICRAETALPFVIKLCQTLAEIQDGDGSPFKLTLGVGVVFARPNIPVHRLHEVAEQLAASAKRRFRGFSTDGYRSVVDWAVYTTSWVDNPEAVRRRDWLRGAGPDARVLSQRPMDMLGNGLDCLQGLVCGASKLNDAPRSQLRYLIDQLPRGRVLSDLAFAELSEKTKVALEAAGIQNLWRGSTNINGPWLTEVLDLVEIYEIGRLGRADQVADDPEPDQEIFDGEAQA